MSVPPGPSPGPPPPGWSSQPPVPPPAPPASPPGGAWAPPIGTPAGGYGTGYCVTCRTPLDPRAEICPRCGVRQPYGFAGVGQGKDRLLAIVFALLLGWIGIHKFYLGKTAQGVVYLLLCWTGIPGFIAWIEAIIYLLKSDEAWAAEYGGPPRRANPVGIGCLWLIALLPLLSIVAIIALIFLDSQVGMI